MTVLIHLDDTKRGVFERALPIMRKFHKVIERELDPGFVAKIHAASVLKFDLCVRPLH